MSLGGCERCCRCGCCGFRIQEYDEASSTNDLVKQAIESGAAEGTVVCARVQTGGYGRQGRSWASPEGGLYMSVLLRPEVPPAQLPTLSLVVGVAVRRALAELAVAEMRDSVQVKWPNDVVLSGGMDATFQKLCGISNEQHAGAMCVGIGVNVDAPARIATDSPSLQVGGKNTPAYLADIATVPPPTVAHVRDVILRKIEDCYPVWQRSGFAAFMDECNEHSALLGSEACVQRADGSLIAEGIVRRIDSSGALVVSLSDGSEQHVMSGEAHIRIGC